MKRILKIVALVVAVLVVTVAALLAPVFLGRRSAPDSYDINGMRVVRDGFVSVAVIPTAERQVALIDAGNDRSGAAILEELTRRGLGSDAVTTILLTHGHPDHIGAVGAFPKAQVMAHALEVDLVEGRASARGPLPRMMPVSPTGIRVTRGLQDGEMITLGETSVRVYAVPGHTAGSTAYLVNGTLFLGDSADASRSGALKGAPWIFSDSQAEDRASLVRLSQRLEQEAVAVKAIVFAHSGALGEGLSPLAAFARENP